MDAHIRIFQITQRIAYQQFGALSRVLNSYGLNSKVMKEDKERLSGEDTREGLTAIVSIKHGDPQFEGQT